jgi:hypothetical protein
MSLNTWGMPYNLGALDKEVREQFSSKYYDQFFEKNELMTVMVPSFNLFNYAGDV